MTVRIPARAGQLLGRHIIDLRGHRRLRGPYTAGGELLRQVVPELMGVDPALVKPASTAVVAIAPDLEADVPIRPQTLTDLARGDERTRFYAIQRTRDLGFMVSELVNVWARTCHPEGVTLRFMELAQADPTDVQLFETLRRRRDPAVMDVVDADLDSSPVRGLGSQDPAQRYVGSDGTSSDPAELAAYESLDDADRMRRHSERGHLLIELAEPGSQLGAIPYHLERGENPAEAVEWLVAGQNQAFREGYYEAALDLGRRGRALLPYDQDPKTHNYLTKRVIGALTYLSRCDEAMQVIDEHRRDTVEVAEQMNDAYMMAMIYTRHLEKDRLDQDKALSWINTALALAEGAPTPERLAFYGAFMRNARALVELHRGNLPGSLDLVNQAIEILDEHLDPDQHQLHRTVLINNRARVLLGLKDYDGAITAFNEVLTRDPEYDEPYFDRAVALKAGGDIDGALRDLDHAIELSVAFTDAYYNRADIRLDLGEEEAALADLDTVLDIDPDYVEALLNRAALLIGGGELDAAAADLDHGLSLRPGHAHLWSAKGLLLSERGDEGAALECYAQALALDPELVEVYGNRAVLHFTSGRAAEAVADLDRAIALTDTAMLRVNRGIGRHELGDAEGAVGDFDAALASGDVDVADVLFRRGLSLHELGEHRRAVADWNAHLRLAAERGEVSEYAAEIARLTAAVPAGDAR
ncbi:tetratricopeptide repeat protein [Nonomuraea sp. M3C6]|uniref:Tetratricopeptide repeat protein n=1 Tax=Nonomuraea marmarensis TaxID=3351344 RepID=A0ABW7ADK8_9ACTN